ncbi:MAG: hypothetical protein QW587_12010, partial [Candidatus Bathyarchaeia archaeon]
ILYAGTEEEKKVRMKPGMRICIPANCYRGLMNDGDKDLTIKPTPVRLLEGGVVKQPREGHA